MSLYSPEEISELTSRVNSATGQTKLLFALFNNHWRGYAPRNANDLKKALQLPFREIPVFPDSSEDERKSDN